MMLVTVFRDVTPCSSINSHQTSEQNVASMFSVCPKATGTCRLSVILQSMTAAKNLKSGSSGFPAKYFYYFLISPPYIKCLLRL
jgi:hypothetical protein